MVLSKNGVHMVSSVQEKKDPRLNSNKLKVRAWEIPFFERIIGGYGARPEPARIAAMNDMKPPNNTKEFMSFIGLVNY